MTWARAATLLLLLASCSIGPSAPRPNVLLISVDRLRRDHLGAYGQEKKTWLLTSRDPAVFASLAFEVVNERLKSRSRSATRLRRQPGAVTGGRHEPIRSGSGETRRQDLESDSGEARELSAGRGEIPERLEAALRVYEGRLARADDAPGIEIGSRDREALRALGCADE